MARYPVPATEIQTEIQELNSRFIATAGPVFSVDMAKAFISRVRHAFPDATHHVPAYLIGYGATVITHCHDDGEPSGTAGRPALAVLRGSGLGDVAVVVTRYFGGTKLGTGGLVRAYSDAVRAVLEVLPRAVRMPTLTVMIVASYPLFERVCQAVQAHSGQVLEQAFAAEVTVTAQIPAEDYDHFQAALQELSNGALAPVVISADEATIVPLDRHRVQAART